VRALGGAAIGRFDLVYREWRVIVEYDGDQHRTSSRQYDRDQLRLEAATMAGWIVVRVRSHALFAAPERMVRRVTDALRQRGWVGAPLRP
jgi:very-short-patch-repair endonuclease